MLVLSEDYCSCAVILHWTGHEQRERTHRLPSVEPLQGAIERW